jgi:hypothetical protein
MSEEKQPTKITQKIVGYRVLKSEEQTTVTAESTDVVLPTLPALPIKLDRGDVLHGSTYKVKQPLYWEHGFYLTINNTVVNGRLLPFEIFITSKNSECLPLLEVLSLTLTSMFRLQIDITYLLDEYHTIQDPKGGYRGKKVWLGEKPKYYTSLLGEFADVIQFHLESMHLEKAYVALEDVPHFPSEEVGEVPEWKNPVEYTTNVKSAGVCPSCQSTNTALMDNCLTCLDCSYSKCG